VGDDESDVDAVELTDMVVEREEQGELLEERDNDEPPVLDKLVVCVCERLVLAEELGGRDGVAVDVGGSDLMALIVAVPLSGTRDMDPVLEDEGLADVDEDAEYEDVALGLCELRDEALEERLDDVDADTERERVGDGESDGVREALIVALGLLEGRTDTEEEGLKLEQAELEVEMLLDFVPPRGLFQMERVGVTE